MNNIQMTGTVPIEPHLLKFVYFMEDCSDSKPLDLTVQESVICFYLKSLLTTKTNLNQSTSSTYYQLEKRLTARLHYFVSERMHVFNKFFLSRESIMVFNRYLHRQFHEILLQRVLVGVGQGQREKQVIYDFMAELGIEDDISFDAVKRASSRLRTAKKIGTIYQQ